MAGRETGLAARICGRSEGLELLSKGSQGCRGRDQTRRVAPYELAANQAPPDRRKQTNWQREEISATGSGVCAERRGQGTAQAAVSGKHGRAGVVVWQVQRFGGTGALAGDHGERVNDSIVGDPI